MNTIPERDWKKLRGMKGVLLDTACERIFQKIQAIVDGRAGRTHAAYLALWKLLDAEDKKIATMFDDLKRSNGILKLAAWRENGLLTEEELASLSDETVAAVRLLSRPL